MPEDDDEDTLSNDDTMETNEIPYLVRGEALGKVKKPKTNKTPKRKPIEKNSDDDFINKLSSIVHNEAKSDDNDEDIEKEASLESVEARDIVETVLERRTKRIKNNSVTADIITEANNQTENESENEIAAADLTDASKWQVTDQIGETDDLALDNIFENSELSTLSDNKNETNTSNELTIQPIPSNDQHKNTLSVEGNSAVIDNTDDDSNMDIKIGWNDEMKRFYDDSWGGETFSLRSIRSRMPSKC